MNLDQLDTLLHESPSPTMRLDPERVLRGGHVRRQRRRTAIGGAVLAGALLVGALGISALRPESNPPLPGGTSHPVQPTEHASSYYDMTDGTKKPGQVALVAPSVDLAKTADEFTLEVTKVNGALRLAKVSTSSPSVTVNLPVVQYSGGMVVTGVGNNTVAVVPTPRDISGAVLVSTGASKIGNATTDTGLLLADGTPVTVFVTAAPVKVTGAYWPRGAGLETNTGRVVQPTRIDSHYSAFVIEDLGVRGVIETDGATTTQPLDEKSVMLGFGHQGGPYIVGRWFRTEPRDVQFAWTGLSGPPPKLTAVQVAGTGWWIAAASTTADIAKTKVAAVTWTDATGQHTEKNN